MNIFSKRQARKGETIGYRLPGRGEDAVFVFLALRYGIRHRVANEVGFTVEEPFIA